MATSVRMANGATMPIMGLGTWQSKPEDVIRAVETAIDVGYRHIDTAFAYQNERAIGQAIANKINQGKIKREDLFITTKLHVQYYHRDDVVPVLKKQCEDLGVAAVDLYLIHAPVGFQKRDDQLFPVENNAPLFDMTVDHLDTWKGMEDAYKAGLTKAIGLSNFNSRQIKRVYDSAAIKPMNLQVECHAHWRQLELQNFCKSLGITFTAYAPLGSPDRSGSGVPGVSGKIESPMEDPTIVAIAAAHKKTPAQVLLRYLIQRDIAVIPKSITPARIAQNFDVFNFFLSSMEMDQINGMKQNQRTFIAAAFASHPEYPFSDPF